MSSAARRCRSATHVLDSRSGNGLELRRLSLLRRDEPLAATLVRDAVLGAKAVEQRLAGDAQLGTQTAG